MITTDVFVSLPTGAGKSLCFAVLPYLFDLLTGQTKCPTCRAQLDFTPDQFNGRKVKGLRVQCPNSVKGCMWQGDLGDATRHTSGTDCPMRRSTTFICQYCRREHAAHLRYTACGSFPLPCPAGCGKNGIYTMR